MRGQSEPRYRRNALQGLAVIVSGTVDLAWETNTPTPTHTTATPLSHSAYQVQQFRVGNLNGCAENGFCRRFADTVAGTDAGANLTSAAVAVTQPTQQPQKDSRFQVRGRLRALDHVFRFPPYSLHA